MHLVRFIDVTLTPPWSTAGARNAALFLALALSTFQALALDKKYFPGQFFMFERSERYESIFGGAVTYLRPAGHDEFERPEPAILIEGVISTETLAHVRRLLPEQTYFHIYLDSPGGDLRAGIELGQLLYKRQAVAIVARGAICKSACALAFLGAVDRLVLADASALGFHRQYRLVDGKVTYGDPNQDRELVAAYLQSIKGVGVSAAEIVSTTGDATFSEATLKARGVVTSTREELREGYKKLVALVGLTQFEILSVICAKYDNLSPKGQTSEFYAVLFSCANRVPAMREPMLSTAVSPLPLGPGDELQLLSSEAVSVLRSSDPEVVSAFNRAADEGRGNYQRRLERRTSLREYESRRKK